MALFVGPHGGAGGAEASGQRKPGQRPEGAALGQERGQLGPKALPPGNAGLRQNCQKGQDYTITPPCRPLGRPPSPGSSLAQEANRRACEVSWGEAPPESGAPTCVMSPGQAVPFLNVHSHHLHTWEGGGGGRGEGVEAGTQGFETEEKTFWSRE